jgi:putative hydrolase of the HAD superfamily
VEATELKMMIFFDIDETLMQNGAAERKAAQTLYSYYEAVLQDPLDVFLNNWKRLTEKNVHRYLAGELSFQGQRRERIRQLFEGKLTLSDPEADVVFDSYLRSYESNWKMFPEVLDCLDGWAGVELGIISNGDSIQQRQKLAALDISDRFAVTVISGDTGVSKPDSRIFTAACNEAGVKPSDCWHVGDDLDADFHGSTSAGIKGVWLNRGERDPHAEIPTIGSLLELKSVVYGAAGG